MIFAGQMKQNLSRQHNEAFIPQMQFCVINMCIYIISVSCLFLCQLYEKGKKLSWKRDVINSSAHSVTSLTLIMHFKARWSVSLSSPCEAQETTIKITHLVVSVSA